MVAADGHAPTVPPAGVPKSSVRETLSGPGKQDSLYALDPPIAIHVHTIAVRPSNSESRDRRYRGD
jgi:hypothetical protein